MLATGLGKAEGPVVRQSGDVVVTSNSLGRIYRLADGGAEVLAETGGGANGAAEGAGGALYVAQSGRRPPDVPPSPELCGGVQVVAADGAVTWLTRDPVAPNDLCFGPDGLLWLTDPTRGRRDDGRLWRIDPAGGESELLMSVGWFPNGMAFGPEDDAVYVAATGRGEVMRLPIDGGRLGTPEVALRLARGQPDGLAFDIAGHLLVAALSFDDTPGEVQVYDADGALLDAIRPGASPTVTNLALTPDRTLIVTEARDGTVWALDGWPSGPLPLHPFRRAQP
jgi:gluconolactonase